MFEGQQAANGATRPFRVKTTLVKKTPAVLVLEREQLDAPTDTEPSLLDQTVYASAHIAPEEHPMPHPAAQTRELPNALIRVGSETLDCTGKTVSAQADFSDWGDCPQATVYTHEKVPGGIVQIAIQTRLDKQPVTIQGKLAEYYVNRR